MPVACIQRQDLEKQKRRTKLAGPSPMYKKNNMLEEITEVTLLVETIEELFEKIREEFGEFDKKSRKVDKLRVLVQGAKTCDKYVQILKRTAGGSNYKGRVLVEEFKR